MNTMLECYIALMANIFQTYVIFRFMRTFFQRESINKKRELISYVVFCLGTVSVYLIFHIPYLNIVSNITGLILIVRTYTKKWMRALAIVISVYAVCMVCDGIVCTIMGGYTRGNDIKVTYDVVVGIALFIVELIAERIITTKRQEYIPIYIWFIMSSIPAVSGLVIALVMLGLPQDTSETVVIMVAGGILIINIAFFCLYDLVLNYYVKYFEKKDLEEKIEVYRNQIEVIQQSQERYDLLRHDMKHHVRMLKAYEEGHKWNEAIEYLGRMEESYTNPEEYVRSGNKEIDSILNYMLQKAYKQLRDVEVKVSIPSGGCYDIYELNIILANLMENAITASVKSQEKYLSIVMDMKKGVLHIMVCNSYDGQIRVKNGEFLSEKEDGKNHGLGLKNVRRVVDSCNGSMKVDYANRRFQVDIVFYLQK